MAKARLRKGKAVGSEKGKGLGCGLLYEQMKEVEHWLYCA
jgi:hypothetical protein